MFGCMLLFPFTVNAFRKVGLEPWQFFAIWYVEAYGKDFGGLKLFPRNDFVRELSKRIGIPTRKALTIINELLETGYLGAKRVTPLEKARMFDEDKGLRTMIFLTPLGKTKLDALQDEISSLLTAMIESRPPSMRVTLKAAIQVLTKAIQMGRRLPTSD